MMRLTRRKGEKQVNTSVHRLSGLGSEFTLHRHHRHHHRRRHHRPHRRHHHPVIRKRKL
jgi:hypothetical protein